MCKYVIVAFLFSHLYWISLNGKHKLWDNDKMQCISFYCQSHSFSDNALVISQKTVIYFWTALNSLISWGTTNVYYLHFLKQDKRLAKHSNVNSWVWSSASIDASLAWQAIVISDDLLSAHEMLLQTLTRMPNYQNLSNQLPIPRGISPFLGFKMSKN